jgi:predicted acyl esterase
LAGEIRLALSVTSDSRAFDLHATLSRVTDGGASYPLAEGYGSFGNQPDPVMLPMRATCATIRPGESLRLSIAAACFPAFPVNPGNGVRPWDATLPDLSVITLHVRTGAGSGSALFLPFVPPAKEPSP